MKCPRCRTYLTQPQPLDAGMPGVLYRVCKACGYTEAKRRQRPRKAKLAAFLRRAK